MCTMPCVRNQEQSRLARPDLATTDHAMKRVLILGSGAREHAIADAIVSFDPTRRVLVAPGNGGTAAKPIESAPVDLANHDAVVVLARAANIEFVVVGPEAPLCDGIVDRLIAEAIPCFGPTKAAARLEASKAFLKDFATRHDIPTAGYEVVRTYREAEAAIQRRGAPIVVKASGLCAGKGVVVATSIDEALAAARAMLVDRVFGSAADEVVLEDVIPGREVSVFAPSDGERFVVLPPVRDHKRLLEGDRGPNTGGMGVVGPVSDVDDAMMARIERELLEPTIRGMREDGNPFRGVLFAGVMITPSGDPFLLEHNVRFGDPECEALMTMLDVDLLAVLEACANGTLEPGAFSLVAARSACVVVLAAAGYPESPRAGDVIEGLEAACSGGAKVFHAGTKREGDRVTTKGGRVLAVAASAPTLETARTKAYEAADQINFAGKQLRRDIGGR